MTAPRSDQRREAGMRTRTRLIEVALDLLAERGTDGVSLRDITGAADANVAAVSYHFGSLRSLCDAAVETALERYLAAQQAEVKALRSDATIEELALAFGRPMLTALATGGSDLAVMRLVARTGIDPPKGWSRFDATFDQIRAECVRILATNLPGFEVDELILRIRLVAGTLHWMILSPLRTDLQRMSQAQLERAVVPVLAGAFGARHPVAQSPTATIE